MNDPPQPAARVQRTVVAAGTSLSRAAIVAGAVAIGGCASRSGRSGVEDATVAVDAAYGIPCGFLGYPPCERGNDARAAIDVNAAAPMDGTVRDP